MILYICENKRGEAFNVDERETLFRECFSDYIGRVGSISLGDAPLESARIGRSARGKPYFTGALFDAVRFSISHSGRFWSVLFADEDVGLDVEDLSTRRALTAERRARIASRFFAANERSYVVDGDPANAMRIETNVGDSGEDPALLRFFHVWTAKESYIKYTGAGIAEGLNTFSVMEPPGGVTLTTKRPASDVVCTYCRGGAALAKEVFLRR
jgi:phosphopantetheinyl transferase